MRLDRLLVEWRALEQGSRIPSDARHASAALHVQALVLDELERRAPADFRGWLDLGAVDHRDQHIRDDQGRGPIS